MKQVSAAGILLAALAVCGHAHAEEDDDSAVALVAGGGVMLASLTAGGLMTARGERAAVRNAGLLGAQSGMVVAPLLAHALVGEPRRGLWFSLPLLVPLAVSSTTISLKPSMMRSAPAGLQYITWGAATVSLVGAAVGVVDAVLVDGRRPRPAASSLSFLPLVGGDVTGAMISGSM